MTSINGSQSNDIITGSLFSDLIYGNEGNDSINGGIGVDTLYGGNGNDVLNGGVGADKMYGGVGNDTYYVDNVGDLIVENLDEGEDSVISSVSYKISANIEHLVLSGSANINGTGSDSDDDIRGNSGNNVINGGVGADYMVGLLGNDTYYVDNAGDTVIESVGQGVDSVISTVSYSLGDNVENLTLAGSAINGAGNALNNIITGNALSNVLDGGAGNDTLNGGVGADSVYGGLGDDLYSVDNVGDFIAENENEGVDTVISTVSYTLASNIENLTLAGSALAATGNELDNVLKGSNLINVLNGGAGNDTLNGGTGADSMYGGVGDDVYYVDNSSDKALENNDEGVDTVISTASYSLASNIENLILSGSAFNGIGNESDNIILGNNYNNIINGGLGADLMYGALGNDVYYVDDSGDVVVELLNQGIDSEIASVSYSLGDNVENLILASDALNGTGNALNNIIKGNSVNNELDGGVGNDTLDGGIGADTMVGGSGNDLFYVDNVDDFIAENENEGIDSVIATISYTLGNNVENLILAGSVISATGNELNNIIAGNNYNNIIDGGLGADTMAGGLGNDTYYVDNSADLIKENANQGIDTVISSSSYTLAANVENLILGEGDNLNGTGNNLNNSIKGNSGDNILNGGAGVDTMSGGLGNDTYVVDNLSDKIIENADEGIDTVKSSITYSLAGNLENLVLIGSANINGTGNGLDNAVTGNNYNNVLNGGAGNDTIDGGFGNDSMYGGTGDDVYYVNTRDDKVIENTGEGADTVVSTISYTLAANIENLTLSGDGDYNIRALSTGEKVITYGESDLWAHYLDFAQGDNSVGYLGVCGIVSSENVLIQSGVLAKKTDYTLGGYFDSSYVYHGVIDTLESSVINVAKSSGLCTTNGNALSNGGTSAEQQAAIIEKYGVQAHWEYTTLEDIAQDIKDNKAVIASVASSVLWRNAKGYIDHAITVTGVAYDANTNAIEGFYICDSGRDKSTDADRFVTYSTMKAAFVSSNNCGWIAVTDDAVKEQLASLDGTGNELDNVITGTEGKNTLDGQAGNDTLIGGAGSDTYIIVQNSNNDTIVDASGTSDLLSFGSGIFKEDISLFANNNDLILEYQGSNQVTIQNQLNGSDAIEKIQLSDNYYLTNSDIDNLIQQISSYAVNNGIQLTCADDVKANEYLSNLVVNSWHAA